MPPGRPVIYNERGIIVETNLGPYNEGVELILTCSVSGGKQNFQYCILWSLIFQDDPSLNPPRDLVCLGQTQFVVLHVKDETECMQVYNLQTIQHLGFFGFKPPCNFKSRVVLKSNPELSILVTFYDVLSNSLQEGRKTARKSRKLDYFGDFVKHCVYGKIESRKAAFMAQSVVESKRLGCFPPLFTSPREET